MSRFKTVTELNMEQLAELKENYLADYLEHWADEDESLSYDILVNAEEFISDSDMFDYYNGTFFTDDDFFCTADY